MSEPTRISAPDGVFPAAQYSHVVMGTGRFVAIAGQLALDEDGKLVGEHDAGAQARQSRATVPWAYARPRRSPRCSFQMT
jgi:enamine deaminase RidA (YjgF/YER057c/UK114 family)